MAKSNPYVTAADESSKPSTSNRETTTTSEAASEISSDDSFYGLAWISICGYLVYRIIYYSYRIRMAAIDEYGPVIHEFDPYFNYRATEVRKEKRSRRTEQVFLMGNDSFGFNRADLVSFSRFFSSIFMSTVPQSFFSGSITWSGTLWDDP